jgi:tetratricopeptide (TPR) repeat protein
MKSLSSILCLFLVFHFGWFGLAVADQTDPRLDGLFIELHETDNPHKTRLIERSIWAVWLSSKSPTLELLMGRVVSAMGKQAYGEALELLNTIVIIAPDYAEGWNKRATIYFLLGQYQNSIDDVERTIDLEPRHFGALSGLGLIYMRLEEFASALDAYERALLVNPLLGHAEREVERLRKKVKGENI